jgi:fused signal recognition particle receptor
MEHDLIIAAVIVVVGGGAAVLVPPFLRRRRSQPPGGQPGAGQGGPGQQGAQQGGTTTLERPPEPGTTGTAGAPAAPPQDLPAAPPAPPAAPPAEKPPPSAGRLVRLRSRLARSQSAFGSALLSLLSSDRLDEETWEEIEDTLITADMGVGPARQLVTKLRTEVKVTGARDPAQVREVLRADLIAEINPGMDRTLHTAPHGDRPAVVLVVGVNGTGKTTACGKLARALIGDGQTVLLGAADTFRAAAADQLQTWAERVGA